MEKVMLDSSVWISLFSGDSNQEKALQIINLLPDNGIKILAPIIVYMEVINWLNRQNYEKRRRDEITNIFLNSKKIVITYPVKGLWHKAIENYGRRVCLKSLDLLILSIALDSGVTEFYSFDRKLNAAYRKLNH